MKILFYFENNWVFGKIHNELIKALYPEIYCDLLDASKEIMSDRMILFFNKYDFVVTTPWAGISVLNKIGGIPLNKIIAVAHGEVDITASLMAGASDEHYNNLAGYAVISKKISDYSQQKNIKRIPSILSIGVFSNLYERQISKNINTIGYVGSFKREDYGIDIKRGHLVKEVAKRTNLNFKHVYDMNFLTIEQVYKDIDILMFSSLTEGNPYSAIEAFASSIPVIGTDVGIFKELSSNGGGFIVPTNEQEFIEESCKIINNLISNPQSYYEQCLKAKEQSKIYDWSIIRNEWINYFKNTYSTKYLA